MARGFGLSVLVLTLVLVALFAGFLVLGPLMLVSNPPSLGLLPGGPTATAAAAAEVATQSTRAIPTPASNTAATATPMPTLTLTPTPTSTLTPAPGSTLTPTSAPSSAPTPAPTSTPTPTSAPTSTLTPTPTPAPTPAPTRTPPRAPTSRQVQPTKPALAPPLLPAPLLGYPRQGMRFRAADVVDLQWKPVGSLPSDAYYVPSLTFFHYGEKWTDETPWLKDCTWRLSDHAYLLTLSDDGVYRWSVRVMRKTGVDAQGRPVGVPVSPASEVWTFHWTAQH